MAFPTQSTRTKTARRKATARATTARDIMTADPETTFAEASLYEALTRLAELGIRHLPVVDDVGKLVGMLSDRDVRTALGDPTDAMRDHANTELTVRDAMKESPLSETMDATPADLAGILADERIGAIPIVDEGDRPVGIVSYVDLLAWFAKEGHKKA